MLYKNMFWFGLGYVTCKHVAPIARNVVVKTAVKLQEATEKQAEGTIKS